MTETVHRKLKNGAEEPEPIVITTMVALRGLFDDGTRGALAAYDMHQLCVNPSKKVSDRTLQGLKELGLVQEDGTVHDSIRNIVLSAFRGAGLGLTLANPIAE